MIRALVPGLLWLLPLAAMPVVFHLFLRLRRQTRVFPSLQFFLAADPHLHARRRIREWLVLALRCAALALLVLALARLQWRGARGGGDVSAVWVVDNSASMSTVDRDGRSRLQRALAAAQALADDPDVRRGGIVTTVTDPAITLPDGLTTDRAVWHAGLEAIRPTHAAGRPNAAIARATVLLAETMAGIAELHVFTDAQAGEWSASETGTSLPSNVRLVVHRVGDAAERMGDVAIEEVALPRRRPVAGRPYRVEAQLRNFAKASRDVVLNAAPAGATEPLRRTLNLPAEGTLRVPLTVRLEGGSEAQVRLWLEGDAAAAGAEAWIAAPMTSGDPVWLAGKVEEFGLLSEAVSPGGDGRLSGLGAETVGPARLREAVVAKPALISVAGAQLVDGGVSAALRDYVLAGGVVLVSPSAVDGTLALPAWCGIGAGQEGRSAAGSALAAATPEAVVWEDLRDAAGSVRLPALRATRWVALTDSDGMIPLLRTAGGETVLAVRETGSGRIYVSGLAWVPAWSDLPRRGAFLALVQTMALTGHRVTPVLRAGDAAAWAAFVAQGGTGAVVQVTTVVGDSLRAEGAAGGVAAPARAGVYRVLVGTESRSVSVVGDAAEADPALVGTSALPWPAVSSDQVTACRGAVETLALVRRGRRGRSLFGFLVGCAVLCALGETWLAQRPAATLRSQKGEGARF